MSSSSNAGSEFQAAIDRTLAVDSMHVEISTGADGEAAWRTSIDFDATDRIRSVSTSDGSGGSESIVIGTTVYFSDLGRPGCFTSVDRSDTQSPAWDLMALLEGIRDSDDVQVEDDAFVVLTAVI